MMTRGRVGLKMLALEQLSFTFPGRTSLDGVSLELRTLAVTRLLGGKGSVVEGTRVNTV